MRIAVVEKCADCSKMEGGCPYSMYLVFRVNGRPGPDCPLIELPPLHEPMRENVREIFKLVDEAVRRHKGE